MFIKQAAQKIGKLLLIPFYFLLFTSSATGQSILPAADGTNTVVTPNGNQFNITGGQLSGDGANLFHSFTQFGLDSNQIANFLSNPDIRNILGRVVGGDPSVINGLIQVVGGNSNLFLMNPSGIIFGQNASLNIPASFTATTATGIGFGNNWFNATGSNNYTVLIGTPNNFVFNVSQPGSIINAGNLGVATEQSLTLLGGTVINTGTLTAPGGNITIVAVPGSSLVRINQTGHLLNLEVQTESPNSSSLISNPLSLPQLLTGGKVVNATGLTVNSDGSVQLTGSGIIVPSDGGVSIASGTIDASGNSGGTIGIFGNKIGVVSANINASGRNGGGTVLIGGDRQGQGTVPNAAFTFISKDSTINVDAVLNGNGGKAIVWADNNTRFWGNISARGGSNGGNGGFVEVSSKRSLTFNGTVNLTAINGNLGTLLLDPENIVIGAVGTDDPQLADNEILLSDSPGSTLYISEGMLESLTGNVILQANNNITIQSLSDSYLDLFFITDITFKAGGSFLMTNLSDTIFTSGSAVNIFAGGDITVGNIVTANLTTGGNISLTSISGAINAVTLDTSSTLANGGTVTFSAQNDINITGSVNSSNINSANGGAISLSSTNGSVNTMDLTSSGDLGGGAITINGNLAIKTGAIDSSSANGNAGSVNLDPINNITVNFINAQGGATGTGGQVSIITNNFFQALGSFIAQNGVIASISTIGGTGGGAITIQHGGGTTNTPFIVGNSAINGTSAAITSGGFTIATSEPPIFTSSFTIGNISISTSITPTTPTTPTTILLSSPISLPESLLREKHIPPQQDELSTPQSQNSPLAPIDIDAKIVFALEQFFTNQFENYLKLPVKTPIKTLDDIRQEVREIEKMTGIRTAIIYAVFLPEGAYISPEDYFKARREGTIQSQDNDKLELVLVTPEGEVIRKRINTSIRSESTKLVEVNRSKITNIRIPKSYLFSSQKLHQVLISPLESDLKDRKIENLIFVLDEGLRSVPLAALHDGEKFLVQKYSLSLMPSLSLTNNTYIDIRNSQVLAMGASQFSTQSALPAVPVELNAISKNLWGGKSFLNEAFTLNNLREQHRPSFSIIHLATHAEFKPGEPENSYIQMWDTKLKLTQLKQLDWNNRLVEMLVLSACNTALGDKNVEMGFAGLAVQSGAKSALASLWKSNDIGTLVLMVNFYHHLKTPNIIKANALRQAQIAMIRGEWDSPITNLLQLGQKDIAFFSQELQELANQGNLAHPYYWASFTMIGNPW